MNSIIRKLTLSAMAMISMAGVWAQPSAPALPEAVINLSKFNGVWQAKLNSTMGDKASQFDYTVKCLPVAGGNGSYWEEYGMDPSMGEMHGSDLFGYNASDAKLHCFSVDNMGSSKDQICEWKSPDHLIIQYSGTSDGKQIEDRLDFTFTGDDVLDFSGTSTADGKTQWSGTGTFHKVQDK